MAGTTKRMPHTIDETGLPGSPRSEHRAEAAVHQRLARPQGDAPEAELHALPRERRLHEVVLADRGAAERDEKIGAAVAGGRDAALEIGEGVAGDAEVERLAAGARRRARRGHRGWRRRSGPALPSRPGGRARRRWRGSRRAACGAPAGARGPWRRRATRRRASRRCPAARSVSPARKSRPLGRTKRPGAAASRTVTASPSRRASSWMTIASAPSGIGAPVKMRTASPAATTPGKPRPASARADDAQRRGRARHVGRAHGVAVHGGSGEGRLRAQGGEVGGERAPVAGAERNVLGREGLAHACEHPAERFLDGKQAHASRGLVVARVAAALGDEPDAFDAHGPVDRLDHVVDRQAGDRDGGEGLHLDAGLARHLHLRRHAHAGQGVVEGAIDARSWSTGAADGRAGSVRACAWPP